MSALGSEFGHHEKALKGAPLMLCAGCREGTTSVMTVGTSLNIPVHVLRTQPLGAVS